MAISAINLPSVTHRAFQGASEDAGTAFLDGLGVTAQSANARARVVNVAVWNPSLMTPLRRTAIVVLLSVTSGATMPIRGAEAARVETAAEIKRDTLSRTIGDAVRAVKVDDGIKLVPAGDSTPGHISTSSQLQPTNLKKVSLRTAIILTAVVIAAVWVTLWLITASKGIYDVSNTAARQGRSAVVPIRPIPR